MSEYWKSTGKKFCEICKCWFADNKISIENHERGLRHKGAVQAKLRDISKKAQEKDHQNAQLLATLAQMEQAAVSSMGGKSFNKNLTKKDDGNVMIGPNFDAMAQASRSTAGLGYVPEEKPLSKYEEAKLKVKAEKEKIKKLKKTAKNSTIWKGNKDEWENPEEESTIEWVKTFTDDGNAYYFNIYTGDTSWEPQKTFYTMEEYQQLYSEYSGVDYADYSAYSQQFYTTAPEPPTEEAMKQAVPIPTKLTQNNGPQLVYGELPNEPAPKKIRTEPEPQFVEEEDDEDDGPSIKPEIVSQATEDEQKAAALPERSAGGLLGPWVPVVKQPTPPPVVQETLKYDDLPEEAKQIQDLQPTFDEIEEAELKFEEKKAPIVAKKSKVIEFKKRKTGPSRNVRTREEFE